MRIKNLFGMDCMMKLSRNCDIKYSELEINALQFTKYFKHFCIKFIVLIFKTSIANKITNQNK